MTSQITKACAVIYVCKYSERKSFPLHAMEMLGGEEI
jgi:hypothetical protein